MNMIIVLIAASVLAVSTITCSVLVIVLVRQQRRNALMKGDVGKHVSDQQQPE